MKLPRWFFTTIVYSGVLLGPLVAQSPVFIVDESGGAGAQFQDLPQAVAAVPDGAVLMVRPGNYTPFTVTGKSLSVIGEDNNVLLNKPGALSLLVGAIGPTQTVVIKNINFASFVGYRLLVRNSPGAVILENVQFQAAAFGAHHVRLETAANVQFHGCQFGDPASPSPNVGTVARITATDSVLQISDMTVAGLGGTPAQTGSGGNGTPALSLLRSRAVAVASRLVGGRGGEGCGGVGCSALPGIGGPAVVVDDGSTLVALGTSITGGRGIDQVTLTGGSTIGASAGGDGLIVMAAAAAYAEGGTVLGGAGGVPAAPAGVAVNNQGGTSQLDPAATPSAGRIRGSRSIGGQASFELDAAPGSVALLLVSSSGALQPLFPLALGSWLPRFSLTIGPLVVPASGTLQLPFQVPVPVGTSLFAQFATVEPVTSRLWVTNSFTLLVQP